MKHRQQPYWACMVLLLAATTLHAQTPRKDSVYVFGWIATAENFFSESAYDSALYYCDKAESYSRQQHYKKGIAYALIEKTDILIDKDDLSKAAQVPPLTYNIGLQLKDSLITAISFMQQAQIHMYGKQYEEAVPLFQKSIRFHFDKHASRYAALAFNDYGYTLGMLGHLAEKATSLLQSINVYESLGDGFDGEKAAAYNNLSTVYYELKDKEKTIEYAKKSIVYREKAGDIARLSIGCCNLSQYYIGVNREEALKYQRLCVKYAEQSGDEARIIHSYITSSLVASEQQDTVASLNYELKTIALLEKSKKEPMMLARRYIAAGMAYSRRDSALADGYFNKAFLLAGKLNDKFNLRDLYYQQAIFYKIYHNYEQAYQFYNKHIAYRDSIIKTNTASTIAELETKYESEKKDNEIARLNAAQEIKALQIAKQEALLAGNVLEAEKKQHEIELLSKAQEVQELQIANQDEQLEKQMLQARNDRQQLELAEKEKQLQDKQLKNTRTVRNLLITGVILLSIIGFFLFNRYQLKRTIAEQQSLLTIRNNIARDLHDEIGSTLTSIKILSEVSGKNLQKDTQKASGYLQKITEQSAAAQQGISDIVWAVQPDNDKLENMVIRMREYAAQTLESRNILTSIVIDESLLHKTLDMQQRRDFFLIYKEAINNIAKYAQAGKVAVTIARQHNHLLLQVTDNGKGFDTTLIGSSSGLKNMKARAGSLYGQLEVRSAVGKGTTVHLEIPIT